MDEAQLTEAELLQRAPWLPAAIEALFDEDDTDSDGV